MITDLELAETLSDREHANICLSFWVKHKAIKGPINPDHPVWEELKAFQVGWVTCKEFYKISD